jgi:hypothetical protein
MLDDVEGGPAAGVQTLLAALGVRVRVDPEE